MNKHANGNLALFPRLAPQVPERHGTRHFTQLGRRLACVLGERRRDARIGHHDFLLVRLDFGRMLAEVFPDHLGREQQVVVVYDDQVAGLVDLGNTLGEKLVGRLVVHPHRVGRGRRDGRVLPEQVVE